MNFRCLPLLAVCACAIHVRAENVVLNIKAENVAREQRAVEVKQYLPVGATPADVVDSAGFDIRYDMLIDCYYVRKVIDIPPGSTIERKVVLRDAWTVPADEIRLIREHLNQIEGKLRNIVLCESMARHGKEVRAGLDRVETLQMSNTIASAGAAAHVAGYARVAEIYETARQNLAIMEDRLVGAGVDPGMLLGSMGSIPPNIIEDSNVGHLQWRISVKNTSKNEPRVLALQQDLPSELQAVDVIDPGVFSVVVAEDGACRLSLREVKLAPNEEKEFVVKIRDRWSAQRRRISALLAQTIECGKVFVKLKYRRKYPSILKEQEAILAEAAALATKEAPRDFGEMYVAHYRDLSRRVSLLERRLERLKRLPLAPVEKGPHIMWIITGILVFLAITGGAVLLRNLLARQSNK